MKQVAAPAPCPEWCGDNEWNVSVWGTYAFTAEDWRDDHYLLADHGWGGGMDVKYFFHRYFGIGVEGLPEHNSKRGLDIVEDEFSSN